MARKGRPRGREELPPPLPPKTRTVGQLVAETLRLYGARFWPSLALGIGPALGGVMLAELPRTLVWVLLPTVGTSVFALAFVAACRIALGATTGSVAIAFVLAFESFLPLVLQRLAIVPGFDLVTLAFFAFTSLAVPAALVEGVGLRQALRRGAELARADFVHAFGSIATLVITIFLTGFALFFAIRSGGEQAVRVSAFLALLVLSPIFLLGSALLYVDQAARVVDSPPRRRRRADADLHPALDADPPGRPDAQGKS